MVRTQIQLTEKQADVLKELAASRYLSIAELIRQAIDNFIQSSAGMDIGERKKKALEIAGKFSSGKNDVSLNHDRYLSEAYKK